MPTLLWFLLGIVFGPALLLVLVYFVWVIASHAVHAKHVSDFERFPQRYSFLGSLPFYVGEAGAMCIVRAWTLLHRGRDRLSDPPRVTGRPILLVHGILQNSSGFRRMRVYLHARGRPTRAVNLGRPFRPLSSYAPPLMAALREIQGEALEQGFDVVAHSMGGLVLRDVLASAPELARGIVTVVTLASPHRGTEGAVGLGWFPDVREMQPGSHFLETLPGLRELLPKARRVTVSVERDYIVHPRTSCHLEGCEARHVASLGHVGLIVHRRGLDALWKVLAETEPSRSVEDAERDQHEPEDRQGGRREQESPDLRA